MSITCLAVTNVNYRYTGTLYLQRRRNFDFSFSVQAIPSAGQHECRLPGYSGGGTERSAAQPTLGRGRTGPPGDPTAVAAPTGEIYITFEDYQC